MRFFKFISAFWVACLCCVTSCSNRAQITPKEMESIVALGHGGMGINSSFPLNSAESINKCLALGLDGSELDVQMTSDGVLVAFHDMDLADATQLEGRIHANTWAALQEAEYKSVLRNHCLLVSLDDLFSGIDKPQDFHFTFDCKLHRVGTEEAEYHQQFSHALKEVLQKHALGPKIAIESQNVSFLQSCAIDMPQCAFYYYPESYKVGAETASIHGFDGITIDADKITEAEVAQAHQMGLKVALWNVKSGADNWKAINKRPDFIQSDDPRHLKNALE